MATDPAVAGAVTGPSVWLHLVQQEVENAGIDNAGAPSNDLADPIFTDLADYSDTSSEEDLVLPSLELEVENTAIYDAAGAWTDDLADPAFADLADPSDTNSEEDLAIVLPPLELEVENVGTPRAGSSDEEELVLQSISVPRSVEDNGFSALDLGPLELIRDDSEDESNVTHICRNSCGPYDENDENTDTVSPLDALVELGCQCRGSMSKMCIKCLLKWFGPRIMLEKDTTCEVCQTRMNESVKKTVLRALADHTGGRDILIEALGPPLVRAHNAGSGLGRMDPVDVEEQADDDVNVDELPEVPNGAAHASLVPLAAPPPDAPPATPVSPSTPAPGSPGSGLPAPPAPAPIQPQKRSFWTKIRRYACCATPTPVLEP